MLTSGDLDDIWTFATIAISFDMSVALGPLPITTTIFFHLQTTYYIVTYVTQNMQINKNDCWCENVYHTHNMKLIHLKLKIKNKNQSEGPI